MRIKKTIRLVVTTLALGIGIGINQTTANAATHYMPRSWRGYYHTSSGRGMKISAHSVKMMVKLFIRAADTVGTDCLSPKQVKCTITKFINLIMPSTNIKAVTNGV